MDGTAADRVVGEAYLEHRDMLYRRMLAATHDPDRADDLVQDAFERLVAEARAGRMPDNAGGWLARVALNLLVSEARHADVERRYEPSLARPATPASPAETVEGREGARHLQVALAALPATDRETILLAANGAGSAELAERLGRTRLAARTLLCRARARLRRELALA
jgi:RNA polymerase sigma-70 factor (ECF subfamily)